MHTCMQEYIYNELSGQLERSLLDTVARTQFRLLCSTKSSTMAMSTLFITILAAILTVQGQQFDGYTFPHDLLGLSQG